MRGYDIIEAMGGIGDDLIFEAKRHKKAVPVWLRWGAMAACLCCAVLVAGVLSLRLFGGESSPEPEMLASGAEVSAAPEQSSQREDNDILTARRGYVLLKDAEYGLKLEVPEDMAEDVVCNRKSGTPFALYEPTAYEALYIESLGTGGGFVWEIIVETYDEFSSLYSLDPTEWTTTLPGVEVEMIGRTEEYVYTVRRPSDVQFTIETETAYKAYKKTGDSILKRFLEINEIEANPEWEGAYSGDQEPMDPTAVPTAADTQVEQTPEAEPQETPMDDDLAEEGPADAEAARDAGVYARDKVYSCEVLDNVPEQAFEDFAVWFETPSDDGRGNYVTDAWNWRIGEDRGATADAVLECYHINGNDYQAFFWNADGTIWWGPTGGWE